MIKLDPEARDAFERQRQLFREKFGREPGPQDPVFFDPDADSPRPIEVDKYLAEIIDAMAKTGVDPAIIYAFRRTGLIVTRENEELLSEDERQAWNAALAEYQEMTKGKPS